MYVVFLWYSSARGSKYKQVNISKILSCLYTHKCLKMPAIDLLCSFLHLIKERHVYHLLACSHSWLLICEQQERQGVLQNVSYCTLLAGWNRRRWSISPPRQCLRKRPKQIIFLLERVKIYCCPKPPAHTAVRPWGCGCTLTHCPCSSQHLRAAVCTELGWI